ncbi:unannotated protein [freshwater metagenome]|uniref:Unannotated protein n=1 Tax=freshwater metagenome TaxID=449393 RepID=A0A6J7XPH3_9ZZZZ
MKTNPVFTFGTRSRVVLVITSSVSMVGFLWPFIFLGQETIPKNQWFFWVSTPLALFVMIAEISSKRLDAKSVALLGVLAAFMAALRPLGAGAGGIEPMWFILIISARVFGSSFGFVLGILAMLTSAFITGGLGPWLGYQAFAAGWIGFLAGALPHTFFGKHVTRKLEIALLALYGVVAGLLFGILMDLQFWPWALGGGTALSFDTHLDLFHNLQRFIVFHFATSMAWDIPRAVLTASLILATAPTFLHALERTKRRASFLTPIVFKAGTETITERGK